MRRRHIAPLRKVTSEPDKSPEEKPIMQSPTVHGRGTCRRGWARVPPSFGTKTFQAQNTQVSISDEFTPNIESPTVSSSESSLSLPENTAAESLAKSTVVTTPPEDVVSTKTQCIDTHYEEIVAAHKEIYRSDADRGRMRGKRLIYH